jgi:hypothetical protein
MNCRFSLELGRAGASRNGQATETGFASCADCGFALYFVNTANKEKR